MKIYLKILICLGALSMLIMPSFTPHAVALQKLSKRKCKTANWHTIGARDALRGRPLDYSSIHEEKCGPTSNPLNLARWRKGYQVMIPIVCTLEFSYGLGEAGYTLYTQCDKYTDDLLTANTIGLQYSRSRRDYDKKVNNYNQSINNIDSAKDAIQRARQKLNRGDLDEKGVSRQRNRISRAKNTIENEESTLHIDQQQIDQAETRFRREENNAIAFTNTLEDNPLYIDLQAPVSVKANVKKVNDYDLYVDLLDTQYPIYFEKIYVYVNDLNTPKRDNDGVRKCQVERKTSSALKKEWRKVRKQMVSLNAYILTITPPSYGFLSKKTITADVILPNGKSLAEDFRTKELSVRDDEAPLSQWYKDKDCFTHLEADEETQVEQ